MARRAVWTGDTGRHGLSPSFAEAIENALAAHAGGFPVPLHVRPDPIDLRDYPYRPSLVELPAFKLPAAMPGILSTDELVVRNQREEGACTGTALAAVIDIQNMKRRLQGAKVPRRVSARMLYSSAQAFDEFPDDNLPGSSVRGVIKGFWNRGVCSDEKMPYLAGWRNDALTVDISHDARHVSLGTYMRLRHVLNDYHCALVEADAIIVSAMVHDGWRHNKVKRARGEISMRKSPQLEGAHAFAIVGYTSKGFLVLNSWGAAWGNYDLRAGLMAMGDDGKPYLPDEAAEALAQRDLDDGNAPGIALWRYSDWQRHVLDAWVLRLAVPTNLPSGVTGGYVMAKAGTVAKEAGKPRRVREGEVIGHIIHFSGKTLVERGLFASPSTTLEETSDFLSSDPQAAKKYRHVALIAHSAFDTREEIIARAGAMTPGFKRNGVYPFFLIWQSNFNEVIGDILRTLMPKALEKAGPDFGEVADLILERMSAPVGKVMWENMKTDARSAFEPGSQVMGAIDKLIKGAAESKGEEPRGLHIIAHGSGAFLTGELLAALAGSKHEAWLRTVSLLAPACPVSYLRDTFNFDANKDLAVYALDPSDEKRPDPRLGGYGKSVLWLIARAFESMPDDGIAGIAEDHAGFSAPGTLEVASSSSRTCRATRHGDFDNDPYTMNHILRRITGRRRIDDGNGGFRLLEIGGAGGF